MRVPPVVPRAGTMGCECEPEPNMSDDGNSRGEEDNVWTQPLGGEYSELQHCRHLIMGEKRPDTEVSTEMLSMANLAGLWCLLPLAPGNDKAGWDMRHRGPKSSSNITK